MKSHAARNYVLAFLLCAFFLLATTAVAQSPDSWPPQASQYRFHVIGNAHIDAPWLWPWEEAMSVVHSTFRSALDRMNESLLAHGLHASLRRRHAQPRQS